MKKIITALGIIMLAVVLICLMQTDQSVQAAPPPSTYTPTATATLPASTGLAEGAWQDQTGNVSIVQGEVLPPAPEDEQSLGTGVLVTKQTTLCHPFRGGQFGWVGQIRQLVNGKWISVDTVNKWVPSVEGQFMACAEAKDAGIYALFGYYDPTK